MPVNLSSPEPADVYPVPGLSLGTAMAGIRKANRRDLTVVTIDPGASVAGVFTANRFCAAPVQLCREHLAAGGEVRAILVNTGNANAGTGADGLARARSTCAALARLLGCRPEQVLPFSTGVIMETLPHERIEAALPAALADARPDGWAHAAEAIMTTDTVPKAASLRLELGGRTVTVTGISKGAGMIHPNMATMLGFVATDAAVEPALMQRLVQEAADESFNAITIDGDTSTNDSFVLVATHRAGNAPVRDLESGDGRLLRDAVVEVSRRLAQAIVRDGEGATKFITVRIEGGASVSRWSRSRANWRMRSFAMVKGRPSSSRSASTAARASPSAARRPTPSAIRRWSRPRSSRAIPTWAGSSPPSAMPASPISTRPGSTSFSTTCTSSKAAGAGRATARKTASAS